MAHLANDFFHCSRFVGWDNLAMSRFKVKLQRRESEGSGLGAMIKKDLEFPKGR